MAPGCDHLLGMDSTRLLGLLLAHVLPVEVAHIPGALLLGDRLAPLRVLLVEALLVLIISGWNCIRN